MKKIFILTIAFLSFNSFAGSTSIVCVDNDEEIFPGKIQLEFANKSRFATKISYARTGNHFVEVSFAANPQNQYFKGGSEYFVKISAATTIYEGKLSLNTMGDQLTFSTEQESFYLYCE